MTVDIQGLGLGSPDLSSFTSNTNATQPLQQSTLGTIGTALLGTNPITSILGGGISALASWYGMQQQKQAVKASQKYQAGVTAQSQAYQAGETKEKQQFESGETAKKSAATLAEQNREWQWKNEQQDYSEQQDRTNRILAIIGQDQNTANSLAQLWSQRKGI